MNQSKQKGFTLVEIAIVLVIVGLLIGGVLKGQEMITNAKIKRIGSDNAGIAAAMFSYQDRYLQLPGDDNAASGRFSIYSGATQDVNGDANGAIDGAWNATPITDVTATESTESGLFFAHLRAADLIAGNPIDDTRPSNAFGGLMGIQHGAFGIPGHVTVFGLIEGPIAKILESRLDDGEPEAGRVRSDLSSLVVHLTADSTAGDYDDTKTYNMAFRL